MQHQIKQQQLLLTISNGLDAFRIQQLASDYYWHTLLPALEEVFNSLSSDDEIVQVDRLEIDFGAITAGNIEQNQLPSSIGSKIREICREKLFAHASSAEVIRKSKPQNASDQWLFYIQYGYMPWNTISVGEQWHGQVLETLATTFSSIAALRKLLMTNANTVTRIVLQHPEHFLIHLAEILTTKKQDNLPVAIQDIYQLINFFEKRNNEKRFSAQQIFNQKIWEDILVLSATDNNKLTTEALTEKIIIQRVRKHLLLEPLPTELSLKLKFVSQVLEGLKERLASEKKKTEIVQKKNKADKEVEQPDHKQRKSSDEEKRAHKVSGLPEEGTTSSKQKQNIDERNTDESSPKTLHEQQRNDTGVGEELPVSSEREKESEKGILSEININVIDESGIFVNHSGIVLIHPFLTTLFNRLHVTEGNMFVDNYSRQKALHIIHFLATGKTAPEEFELVVPKLLCNYPIDEPAPKEIMLTQEEQSEAEDMLRAVIMQWNKIKNTSVDAFRESFLQRAGKLYTKNNSLYLQVEAHAIDILLDYLPWTLSLVKLPWMKEMLHVEWR